jgi:hypothetical protein
MQAPRITAWTALPRNELFRLIAHPENASDALSGFIELLDSKVIQMTGEKMNCNGWKSNHRALFVACLCAGMALLVKAESHSIENDKKAEIKGVIISRSGDLVKIQEKKSGDIELVKLGDGTIIERKRGLHSFFRHADMDVTALVPGLTIEAEGLGNADGELEATKIKFNPDVFAVEIARIGCRPCSDNGRPRGCKCRGSAGFGKPSQEFCKSGAVNSGSGSGNSNFGG